MTHKTMTEIMIEEFANFAYSPKKQVDGIVVCRCPKMVLGIDKNGWAIYSKCSYHTQVVDLNNRFVQYHARKIQGDGNSFKSALNSLRKYGKL